jgi:hypothetical protein
MTTREMNMMTEQTWVIIKVLTQNIFLSLDQDHMNNDQLHKSREVENKVNNQ